MAPERIREQEAIDGRSDLFSVGVVVYEMLTGVCPFAASSPAASLAAVLEVVVDPDPRIDPRLWIELRRSLSKHPYERQATAVAMASGLIAACGETIVSLGEILRQAPVAREVTGGDAAPAEPTVTVGGHSLGGGNTPRLARKGATVALLAATLVVSAALAALSGAFRAERVVRAPSPATDLPGASPVSAPTREAASAMVPLPPPVPPAATTAPSRRPPVRPPHPRPVATTPGF